MNKPDYTNGSVNIITGFEPKQEETPAPAYNIIKPVGQRAVKLIEYLSKR